MSELLQGFYMILVILLACHASQYWALVIFCPKRKSEVLILGNDDPLINDGTLPKVTVQIPVFNERYMVSRIINAIAKLDYPSELLHIQVLDDSTDDTPEIARVEVDKHKSKGINIELIHRPHRDGFKAGALAEGLKSAEGEFIAIFDADFVPHVNFLRRLIVDRRGFEDPKTGFLQTRWVYLNRTLNKLTRAQGQLLDSHFFIDHATRCKFNLPFNFNGSGGIWRKSAIEDAGGWQLDTLTEDFDLSYRAKMKGWHGVYYVEEEAPNDLPTDIMAFKQQQKRWARGNAQCLRKLIFSIITSKLSPLQKLSSAFHMIGYFVCAFLMLFVFIYPLLALQDHLLVELPVWIHYLGIVCLGFFMAIFVANVKRGGGVIQFFRDFGFTLLIMIGISVSNTVAVTLGLFRKQIGVFDRTPKEQIISNFVDKNVATDINNRLDDDANKVTLNKKRTILTTSGYRLKPDWTMWLELLVSIYAIIMAILIINYSSWMYSIPMFVYAVAFGFISLMQVWEVLKSKDGLGVSEPDVLESFTNNDVTYPAE